MASFQATAENMEENLWRPEVAPRTGLVSCCLFAHEDLPGQWSQHSSRVLEAEDRRQATGMLGGMSLLQETAYNDD